MHLMACGVCSSSKRSKIRFHSIRVLELGCVEMAYLQIIECHIPFTSLPWGAQSAAAAAAAHTYGDGMGWIDTDTVVRNDTPSLA